MLSNRSYYTKLGKLEAAVKRAQLEVDIKLEELTKAEQSVHKATDELEEFINSEGGR